jgi:hypothetical protein
MGASFVNITILAHIFVASQELSTIRVALRFQRFSHPLRREHSQIASKLSKKGLSFSLLAFSFSMSNLQYH